jgi:disulfide bond formation protein DsbB
MLRGHAAVVLPVQRRTNPVLDLGKAGSLFDNFDKVKVIRCDEVQWRFLGLSLAGYNVLISLAIAALAAWGIARSKRAASSS